MMVRDSVDLYMPPFLFVVGVTCNVIVIVVMRQKFFCNVSTSVYITFNAFFDNISLLLALPAHWVSVNFPEVIYRGQHSDLICKFLHFTGWLTSDLGIILTVAMTLERAIAVKYPLQVAIKCTTKRAKIVIAVLFFVVVLKDCHVAIQSRLATDDSQSRMCELDLSNPTYKYFNNIIWTQLHNVFLVLSFVLIIASNIVIVRAVQSSGTFPSMPSIGSVSTRSVFNSRSSVVRGRQLTIMLISDSITIVVCTLPFAIYSTIVNYVHLEDEADHWLFTVVFYLLYVNRCANFFLYCVSGERFRQTLLAPCRERGTRTGTRDQITVFVTEITDRSADTTDRSTDITDRSTDNTDARTGLSDNTHSLDIYDEEMNVSVFSRNATDYMKDIMRPL